MEKFKVWEARRRDAPGQQTFNWDAAMPKPEPERIVLPQKKKSPLMQQWEEAKKKHPNMLLLFRVGDFYELFKDDAEKAAKLLNITLTTRTNGTEKVAMAGFPYHVLEKHLQAMLQAGLRVAILEPVKE